MSEVDDFDVPIWPGSSSFATGSTPFGFYDTDTIFASDADKVALWAACKLGYPITDVELQDKNFYACFEEAVTEYSAQITNNLVKDNMLNLIGAPTGSALDGKVINSSLEYFISIAKDYGTEAGTGGNVTWRTGSISIQEGVQRYDIDALFTSASHPGETIEIKRIFHHAPPAIVRYFDPFLDSSLGSQNMLDGFGFGGMSPSVTFLMMPMYQDLLRLQAIEFNDQIRKSAFSFEISNNNLKIFPVPTFNTTLHFEYIIRSERADPTKSTTSTINNGLISDSSNVPYGNLTYSNINALGRRWIFRYTAALAMEMLGWVRTKYSSMPIPNGEVTLNGDTLLSNANTEKDQLLEELRGDLEALNKRSQMEKNKDEAEFLQEQLNKIPLKIYIG